MDVFIFYPLDAKHGIEDAHIKFHSKTAKSYFLIKKQKREFKFDSSKSNRSFQSFKSCWKLFLNLRWYRRIQIWTWIAKRNLEKFFTWPSFSRGEASWFWVWQLCHGDTRWWKKNRAIEYEFRFCASSWLWKFLCFDQIRRRKKFWNSTLWWKRFFTAR